MQACREKTALTVPICQCHLCGNRELTPWDEDGVDTYAINGTLIKASDVENCVPPTIFCKYLEMWKSQFIACCCTGHDNPEDCKLNGKVPCDCPRCCLCMRKIVKDWSSGKKIDCRYCTNLKFKVYVPCKHLRGYCTD